MQFQKTRIDIGVGTRSGTLPHMLLLDRGVLAEPALDNSRAIPRCEIEADCRNHRRRKIRGFHRCPPCPSIVVSTIIRGAGSGLALGNQVLPVGDSDFRGSPPSDFVVWDAQGSAKLTPCPLQAGFQWCIRRRSTADFRAYTYVERLVSLVEVLRLELGAQPLNDVLGDPANGSQGLFAIRPLNLRVPQTP